MKKTFSLSLITGLCLTPLVATPAFASPTPPAPSAATAATPLSEGFEGLVVERVIVAVDREERAVLASVTVTGADPTSLYVLSNPAGLDHPNLAVAASGRGHATVELVPGELNHLKLLRYPGGGAEPLEFPIEADDTRSYGAPKVDVVEHADTGRADVTVTGEIGAEVYLLNSREIEVTRTHLDTASHTFDVPLMKNPSSYSAIQIKDYYRTPGTAYELGAADPDVAPIAPTARAEYRDDTRALISIEGDAETVVKVRDEDGRIIGCRMVPADSAAQVFVPLGSDEVDVTVTRGTTESEATPVDLTAAPTR